MLFDLLVLVNASFLLPFVKVKGNQRPIFSTFA